jgi:tetratricopeptide (TPR) repeat protein
MRHRPSLAAALLLLAACARPAPPPPLAPAAEPARAAPSDAARAEAQALYLEAEELARADRFQIARPKLERAVRLDPTHSGAHVILAEAYWRSGRWDEAVREAESGRDADPSNVEAWSGLAGYYRGLERDAESDAAARRWAELVPDDPMPWKALADLGYDRRNYPLCVEGAEGAIRVVEQDRAAAAASELAKQVYEEMLLFRSVCKEAVRIGAAPAAAGERDHAAEQRAKRARRQFLEGTRATGEKRFASATLHFEQALATQPDDVETLLRLSDARWRTRRVDDAIAAAERALELEPTNTAAISALAVYQRQLERWAESEKSYRRFAELAPGDPWGWGGLGMLGFESGKWALCVEGYERQLAEIDRRDPRLFSEQTKQARAESVDRLEKCRAKRR